MARRSDPGHRFAATSRLGRLTDHSRTFFSNHSQAIDFAVPFPGPIDMAHARRAFFHFRFLFRFMLLGFFSFGRVLRGKASDARRRGG